MVQFVTRTVVVFFAISLVLAVMGVPVPGQNQVKSRLPLDRYDQLYKAMFPQACDSFTATDQEYALDVRVRPSFNAPYQISISKQTDQGLHLIAYHLLNEREPLGEQVARLLAGGIAMDAQSLAHGLNIKKSETSAPSRQTRAAIGAFFGRHSFPKQTGFSLDGVGYDICYIDRGSSIRATFDGGEVFERGEASMITWARKLASTLK